MCVFYTLFYLLSTFFIIQLAPTFNGLTIIEQTRIILQFGLIAFILAFILSLCVSQYLGINQVGQGIDDILILIIFQGLMAIIHGGINTRKIFLYLYFLPTAIIALFLPRTRKRKSKKRSKRDKKSAAVEEPLTPTTPSSQPATPSLIVFDKILGHGTNNAVVYEGSFQGRAVAVKCYQQDLLPLATREVSFLQQLESDDHPNVVRYHFYQESDPKFFFIALDFCPGSLADVIENREGDVEDKRREEWKDIAGNLDERKAMKQIASGLKHLHGLGLIHRDIKPQNVLISSSTSRGRHMLISDFGLCKRLDVDQSSSLPTTYGSIAAGTAGWRAPEMLQCRDDELESLDTLATSDNSTTMSSLATTINGSSSGTSTTTCQCLSKSVDIFALGCLFYYILTKGRHPYGNRFDRDANIIKDIKDLSLIYSNEEAHDLITHMLHRQPSQRPDIETCLLHPFFWDPVRRLGFLRNASDTFEVMCKDPMDRVLIRLERDAKIIIKTDWRQTLDQSADQILIKNLRQSRGYDGNSVRDLLRVLRNKRNHYQDLPHNLKLQLGSMPDGFLKYFTSRFPRLLVYVHEVVKDTGLYRESQFKTYFELPET